MKKLLFKLGIVDIPSFWQFVLQFIKFGLVGLLNTGISLIIYYALMTLGVNYLISNAVGFIISVLNSFFWNSKFVFKGNSNKLKTLAKTFISYGSTFLLSTFLLYLMVAKLSISVIIAPILNLLITVPLNFFINKFWTYGNSKNI